TKLIRDNKIGIVHARSRAPAWSAYLAARRTGAIFVTTYHGFYKASLAPKRFYNSIMARGEAVIANSHFTADHILAEHHIEPKKLHVIPRGIDIDTLTPDRVTRDRVDALRKQWDLAPGKP